MDGSPTHMMQSTGWASSPKSQSHFSKTSRLKKPAGKKVKKERQDPRVRKMLKRIDDVEPTPMEALGRVLMDHATNAKYDCSEFNDLLDAEAFLKSYEMDANAKGTHMLPTVSDKGCFFAYKRMKTTKKKPRVNYNYYKTTADKPIVITSKPSRTTREQRESGPSNFFK